MSLPNVTPPSKAHETGCLSPLFSLAAMLLAALSTVGFIFGLFGKKMRYKNMDLGLVDLPTYLGILAIAAFFFGTGYLIDYVLKRRNQKRNRLK